MEFTLDSTRSVWVIGNPSTDLTDLVANYFVYDKSNRQINGGFYRIEQFLTFEEAVDYLQNVRTNPYCWRKFETAMCNTSYKDRADCKYCRAVTDKLRIIEVKIVHNSEEVSETTINSFLRLRKENQLANKKADLLAELSKVEKELEGS